MHGARLLRLELQTEFAEHVAQQGQRLLCFLPAPAEHHLVVGVTYQHAPALRIPGPVQPMQVDVGQQEGHTPPCGVPVTSCCTTHESITPARSIACSRG